MDPVYVTQTTIAVTILHKIHYSIEALWVLLLLLYATGSDVITGSDVMTRSDVSLVTGSDVSHVTGSDVSHVTGSDVFFPRFFLTIVVVQNVPLHGKLEDTKRIIRSRKSNDKQQWDILYYYYSKEKARGTYVTSGHVTDVTSGYGSLPDTILTSLLVIASLPVTWLTSLPVMTSLPVAQSSNSSSSSTHRVMIKNPIIFCLEPLYCKVFYVI